MLVSWAGFDKMRLRTANREDHNLGFIPYLSEVKGQEVTSWTLKAAIMSES